MIRSVASATFTIALVAAPVAAQGTLSTQGFGYPPGQFSARARATGGGLAEFDPASQVNPAGLLLWGRSGLYFEYAPEFRSVKVAGASDESATIVRFPGVAAFLSVGRRAALGLAASTFLDRTWETVRAGTERYGADSARFNETFSSSGAINDVRLGAAYAVLPSLHVGLAAHALTGENRLRAERVFIDSGFAPFAEQSRIDYAGTALSAGLDWRPIRALGLAVSGRLGGRLCSYRNDTTLTSTTVPARVGFGVRFGGIAGTVLAVSAAWQEWSKLGGLAASDLSAFDGWDIGAGAEVKGPRWFGGDAVLRGGFRRRTLPFGAGGEEVREVSYALGFGVPLARNRAAADFGVQRATRTADINVEEVAWTVSVGFSVRP